MTVTCESCGTDNRDKAMFCRGCLARLPAFALTPVDRSEADIGANTAGIASTKPPRIAATADQRRRRSRFSRYALSGAVVLAVVGCIWFARGEGAGNSASHGPVGLPAVSERAGSAPDKGSSSIGESLAPGETWVEQGRNPEPIESAGPATAQAPAVSPSSKDANTGAKVAAVEPAPANPTVVAPSEPGRRPIAQATRSKSADPRQGCEHLFFAFAERCEANHCLEAAYARHPRCDVIRRQRLIDERRRDAMPTS
jgi:hypothetical protein